MDNSYEFVDDQDLIGEYFNAVKNPEKKKGTNGGTNREDFLKFLSLKDGESAQIRIVQVPKQQTFLRAKQHFLGKTKVPGLFIPPNVKFTSCLENPQCIGEQVVDYIRNLKYSYPRDSQENKDLWQQECNAGSSETMYLVCILRHDLGTHKKGDLVIYQANNKVSAPILKLSKSPKYGNPAHPTNGYDFTITRKSKNDWLVDNEDDPSPLTEEELKKVQNCKFTWSVIQNRNTVENQAKLGIKFGVPDEKPLETPQVTKEEPTQEPLKEPFVDDSDLPF